MLRRRAPRPALIVVAFALLSGATASTVYAQASARDGARPGFRQVLAEALEHSPTLRAPRDGVVLADIQQRVAASRFGLKVTPSLTTGSDPTGLAQSQVGVAVHKRLPFGTDVTLNASSLTVTADPQGGRDLGYTFSVTQPLLRGFGPAATNELNNARRSVEGSARSLEDARQQLVLTVAETYFGVVREQRFVEASERALDRALKLKRASEARASVGLATQLDVLRADLMVAQSDASLAAQRESLASRLDQLKLLMGRPIDAPLEIAGDDPSDVVSPFVESTAAADGTDRLIALAWATRLDVREAADRIGDARRNFTVARWNLLPPVNLTASYTRRGLGSAGNALMNDLFGGWRVGLSTGYSLDRTAEIAATATANLSVQSAERTLGDLRERVAGDVRRAVRSIERARASIAIQTKAVDLAAKQVRLAELRYERGLAGNFDVIDAESNLYQAQTALVSAEVDRTLATLALARATGTLDPERVRP